MCDWWEERLLEERYRQAAEEAERVRRTAEKLTPGAEPRPERKPETKPQGQPDPVPV